MRGEKFATLRHNPTGLSLVDERTLREIYLPAFETSVKEGGALYLMVAYNKLNGSYCSANHWLLTKVLRNEWGFKGLIVSDWGATHEGAGAVKAGLDLEMPGPGDFLGPRLADAVAKGDLDEKTLDARVRNILRVSLKLD